MKKLSLFVLLGVLVFSCQSTDQPAKDGYDVVILNGRVMEPETRLESVMNVGIKDGMITVMTTMEITG